MFHFSRADFAVRCSRCLPASIRHARVPVLAGLGLFGGINAAMAQTQPLHPDTPHYFRFAYPAAMSAPLPSGATVGRPFMFEPVLEASQAYANTNGLLGIYQSSGAVLPSSNAFFQALGTNGRSCFSCHRPTDGMSLNTNTIRSLYMATAGRDPIFAPVDGANCPSSVPRTETVSGWLGGRLGGGRQSSRDAHSLLLNKGLFRIFLPVPKQTPDFTAVGGPPSHPTEFTISVVSDPYGCNTNPAYAQQVDPVTQETQQMISVYRRPRMSANLKFITTPALSLGSGRLPNVDIVTGLPIVDPSTGAAIGGNIMLDGREPTLESQARNATLGHAQALKPPTEAQISQIVAFEKGVFAAQSYHAMAGNLMPGHGSTVFGGPKWMADQSPTFAGFALYDAWPTTSAFAGPTKGARASIARGQALFNTRSFSVSNVAGFNNATVLRATNPSIATCVSCHGNLQAGNSPLPGALRDIGTGGHATQLGGPALSKDLPIFKVTCKASYTMPYYGKEVLTNDPGQALITGRCSDVGRKSVPQLRALASRAPYFSDGSVASIRDTVLFYDKRFGMGLTTEEIDDLTHFLEAL